MNNHKIIMKNFNLFSMSMLIWSLVFSYNSHAKRFDTASEYYEDAVVLMSENSAAEAEIQLKNALQLDKSHLPSQILLGILYLKLDQHDLAEKELIKARNLGADPNLIAVPLGQVMLNLQKYSKLERFVGLKNRNKKNESKLQILLGSSYLSLNRTDDAINAYLEAERLDPDSIYPLMAQLSMTMSKGQIFESKLLLERLLNKEPENTSVLMRQAQLMRVTGNVDEAIEIYNKILKLNPEHVNARVSRAGILQVKEGDQEWVIKELKPIIDENEEFLNPEITTIYSMALIKTGRIEEARKLTAVSRMRLNFLGTEILNQYPSLLFLDVVLAIYDGEFDKASDSAQRLLRISGATASSRLLLGQLYLEMGEGENALQALEPLFVKQAKDPLFLMLHGRALYLAGNPNDALYELEDALRFGNDNREVHLSLGLVRRELGKLDEAARGMELALDKHPDDIGIASLLMDLYIQKGDYVSAEVVANDMLKQNADDPRILDYLGRVFLARGEVDNAIAKFTESTQVATDYVEGYINLARAFLIQKKFNKAEAILNQALSIDNENHDAMIALAEVSDARGDIKAAIRWLERLHDLMPERVPEALMLNSLYLREGKVEEAMRLIQGVYEKNGSNFSVLVALIETQIQSDRTDDAVKQLESSLRYSSDFSSRELLTLSSLQKRVGDLNGAAKTLEKSIYMEKDFAPARISLIQLYTEMRNFEQAISHIEELKLQYPEKNIAYAMLGDVHLEREQYEEAFAAFKQAKEREASTEIAKKLYLIEKKLYGAEKAYTGIKQWAENNTNDWNAQYAYALSLIDTNQFPESLTVHHKILETQPENPFLLNNIAWLMQKTGSDKALGYIANAYKLYPENAAILDTYGWILTEKNKADQGVGYLREALSRDSENPSVQYHLAKALVQLNRIEEARKILNELEQKNVDFYERAEAMEFKKTLKNQ